MNKPLAKRKPVARKKKKGKTAYTDLEGDQKVAKNWRKSKALHERGEYSVAIIRCATCVELAVNFAIREEMIEERKLPSDFVDQLLKSANGLTNKYQKLYLPVMEEYSEHDKLKSLWKDEILEVNKQRNGVVHSGEFRVKSTSKKVIDHTYNAIKMLLGLHGSKIKIRSIKE